MLIWKVCWCKDPCAYACVRRRKRKPKKDICGAALIIAASLILLCVLPIWVIALFVCAVLVGLGVIWLCT
ncbi:MAG TPA: hypothetical protein PKX46_05950 [Clostridia bacterium]|nr:MAG: hypothetical protein BWY62_00169 [Firmicutes bacterium ADurb.Bin356]HOF94462.1 hypothetical protein [Clostridia bacterium]HOR13452.1 hypothetical protein [Clostridia bacterium]